MKAIPNNYLTYPQKTPFGILKSSFFWKAFIVIASPIFHFFWEFVVNAKEKVLYLTSKHRGPMRPELKRRSLELVENNEDFVRFAKELRGNISEEILKKNRDALMASENREAFISSIQEQLPLNARIALLRFALDDKQLNVVLPYFKVVPRLNSMQVMFNIVKPGLKEEGSKSWHFDDGYYKSLNLFLCITDLSDENGPYSAVGTDACPRHAAIPLDFIDRRESTWVNQRHTDELLYRYIPRSKVLKMVGPAGTAAWVDSGACYHKGGHCKSAERLMLQIHYSTELGAAQPSLLNQLGLEGNREAEELLNTPVKRYMASGTAASTKHKIAMRLKNPMYFIGRRILCYYLKPV